METAVFSFCGIENKIFQRRCDAQGSLRGSSASAEESQSHGRLQPIAAQPPCPPSQSPWLSGAVLRLVHCHYQKPLKIWQLQADITSAAVSEEERHHILSCLPTGMGKTLPMLLTSQLLPLGNFLWSWTCVPIGTRPFKVQRRWLSHHSPPSSCNWRATATSLAFQLLLETRYCQLDLEMCTVQLLFITFIAPHYYECQLLFLSYSQKTSRGSCWSVPRCSLSPQSS